MFRIILVGYFFIKHVITFHVSLSPCVKQSKRVLGFPFRPNFLCEWFKCKWNAWFEFCCKKRMTLRVVPLFPTGWNRNSHSVCAILLFWPAAGRGSKRGYLDNTKRFIFWLCNMKQCFPERSKNCSKKVNIILFSISRSF